ncbi:HD domain-containing protein [Luteimonas yindakuii]|uniref:HD domain-containing protein n=1 Tax=Luteimonas yindakuii TaxID=2565782 RepID=UPI0010A2FC4A|nr:HD domain-containing protein [Luteimonas yindakuii]QCO66999.1 HD domain-containing protein [Luteimonas yindakuii]
MAASIAPDIDVMPGVLIGPAQGQNTSSSTCLWRVSHGHTVTEYLIPSPSVRSQLLMHSLTRHVMQVVRWDSEAANDNVPVITSADYDPDFDAPLAWLPDDLCPRKHVVAETVNLVAQIQSDPLRRMTERVLLRRDVADTYWTMPASVRHHHAFPGGLATHSLEVALDLHSQGTLEDHERDICVAAGLLHDIGKCWAYTEDMFPTTQARAVGHELLGLSRLHSELERLEVDWPDAGYAMRALLSGISHRRQDGSIPTALLARVRAADQRSCERDRERKNPIRTWTPRACSPPPVRISLDLDEPF